jgi:hypothetical protein
MTPFETAGFWHTPDVPSRQVAGTLRYSAEDGLRLSLTGSFGEGLAFELKSGKYPVIHGIVNDSPCGRAFTLVDCFRTKRTVRMPGFATEDIRANRAYAGDDFLSKDALLFDSVSLEPSALDSWISTTGISSGFASGAGGQIGVRYSHADNVSLVLNGQTLTIGFGATQSQSHRSYSLRERVSVKIADLGQLPFEEISRQYTYPLQNFFTLATDHPNALDSVVLYHNNPRMTDGGRRSPIHYLAQPIYTFKEDQEHLQSDDMLFTYEDVRDHLPGVMKRWFEFDRKFHPFCLSFFGLLYAPNTYVEERFLTLINSIVLFFQGLDPADETIVDALNEATKTLRSCCSGKNAQWLADAMPTTAELELPWNLRRALDEHHDIMAPLAGGDLEGFVDHVLVTRKYCRHRDPAFQENAAQAAKLYWLTEKLKVLVKTLLLEWLGIPGDLVGRLIKRNRNYAHLVSLGDSGQ